MAAYQTPDFRTLWEFRRIHWEALKALFVQVLALAEKAGLVRLGQVALDGTKVKANASKHKAMSYERRCAKEAEYAKKVEELRKGAEEADAAEDQKHGADPRGDELPEERRFQQSRLKKMREAKKALEEEAKAKARAEGKRDGQDRPGPPANGKAAKTPAGTPDPKAQKNFTDATSRILKTGNGSFEQAFNGQAAGEGSNRFIVAEDVTQEAKDKRQVVPMREQVEKNLREKPGAALADNGYSSEANVPGLREEGVDDDLCADRLKHGEAPPPSRGRIPEDVSFIDRVRRKRRTKKGRET